MIAMIDLASVMVVAISIRWVFSPATVCSTRCLCGRRDGSTSRQSAAPADMLGS